MLNVQRGRTAAGVLSGMEYLNGGPGLQIVKILHILVQSGQFYAGGKNVGGDFPPPLWGNSLPQCHPSFYLTKTKVRHYGTSIMFLGNNPQIALPYKEVLGE